MTPLPVAILAGGLATRLEPLTCHMPKSLVSVAGEPFIAHQLRLLKHKGVRRVVLCVGHYGDQIRNSVGNGEKFGIEVVYSDDGEQRLGTGGALRKAAPLLGDAFLALYGDSYLDCDYDEVSERFVSCRKPALMTVFRNESRWQPSNIHFANGRIVAYSKTDRTPAMTCIDYGLGAIETRALDRIPRDAAFDLAHFYQALLAQGQLAACEVMERFYEIGSFAGIRELEDRLKRQGESLWISSRSS